MSGAPPHRSVTPLIDLLRTIVRGRKYEQVSLRFSDELAARTQPLPALPGGPYCKTTEMYYYKRDGRREVQPPTIIATSKQIQAGKEAAKLQHLTPGKVYCPN